ncbi:MAG: A/G-specific adenine glycosylase [Flavobacteriales bacterium]|jgi:A/G-specific adenine glycosylase
MNPAPALIRWYRSHKRDLPWRDTSDPYAIWLSEVILQQTRVDQGLAYYLRFLERFPDVKSLANAPEQDVLRLWQGLGYYSRARNLLATARIIRDECDGVFPHTYDQLLVLRGIGPYTAAAIASFAFGECKAVVDGNVVRVLARFFGIPDASDTPAGMKAFRRVADELIPESNPAEFNQAIMEFGALQCTPRNPSCETCPLRAGCSACNSGRVSELPARKKRVAVRDLWFYYFVPDNGPSTWMRRRVHSGIWKGLHDFPCIESDKPIPHSALRKMAEERLALALPPGTMKPSAKLDHVLSHRKIHAVFFETGNVVMGKNRPDEYRQVAWKEVDDIGIPRLIDRYLEGRAM